MAHIQKDRSLLKHRAYYTVHRGADRYGKIIGTINRAPGRSTFWMTRSRDCISGEMRDDLGFLTFSEAKAYALKLAEIDER